MSSPLGLLKNLGDYRLTNPVSGGKYTSMMNFGKFYYRPNGDQRSPSASKQVNNNTDTGSGDIYNTSIDSIVEWSKPKTDKPSAAQLKYADFAFLRDVGVFPNNRLIIARRFPSPVYDDLTLSNYEPISKIVGWVKDEDEFYNFSFAEEWEEGQTSIKNLLNNALESNRELGGFGAALSGLSEKVFPNGGYMDAFRFELLNALGYTNLDSTTLPSGNPNLIQESAMRKIPGEEGGSGLKGKFVVEFETTYEQKFIKGVDPTIAYLDILQNILRFGTSEAQFYLRADTVKATGTKIGEFFNNLRNGRWEAAIMVIIKAITNSVKSAVKTIGKAFDNLTDLSSLGDALNGAVSGAIDIALNGLVSKYKIQFMSVISAMTGEPSAPWHVTIGNPKKPFFSCGDLVLDGDIEVSFGKTLHYNDLPSTIKVKVKLKSARNMGLSELFDKFNVGTGRSYVMNPKRDSIERDAYERGGIGETSYGKVKESEKQLEANNNTASKLNDDNKKKKEDEDKFLGIF